MKKNSVFIIFLFILANCAPINIPSTATLILNSTITPSVTPSLLPTNTHIPPSPTLEPELFVFDIAPNAPAQDVASIKLGIELARAYLRDFLGGDIQPNKQEFIVKIVADGKGNEGSCCTALADSGPRPFFDVNHPVWLGLVPESRISPGAHEYVHAWQSSLGCLDIHNQPMDDWLTEGMAEYIALNAMRHGGYLSEDEYVQNISFRLYNTKLEDLSSYGHHKSNLIYDLGFVALDKLVSMASTKELSLRTVCELIALGESEEQAFYDAFGISKTDFYTAFASYQKSYTVPITPIALTPPAGTVQIQGNVISTDGSDPSGKYYITPCKIKIDLNFSNIEKCLPGAFIQADGGFYLNLIPGSYYFSINPTDGGEAIGWYTENGLVSEPTCAKIFKTNENQNISIKIDPKNIRPC